MWLPRSLRPAVTCCVVWAPAGQPVRFWAPPGQPIRLPGFCQGKLFGCLGPSKPGRQSIWLTGLNLGNIFGCVCLGRPGRQPIQLPGTRPATYSSRGNLVVCLDPAGATYLVGCALSGPEGDLFGRPCFAEATYVVAWAGPIDNSSGCPGHGVATNLVAWALPGLFGCLGSDGATNFVPGASLRRLMWLPHPFRSNLFGCLVLAWAAHLVAGMRRTRQANHVVAWATPGQLNRFHCCGHCLH